MPDREFIHSSADVPAALIFAVDSGLQVLLDEPQPDPTPRILDRTQITELKSGVFFLFRPEWVHGPFQFLPIPGGYDKGKYSISPGVNFAPITLYFQGERTDHGQRRLGSCSLSWHRDWLEMPAKVVRTTPPEVEKWYKRIAKHLSSDKVVQAGVHRYRITRGVASDPAAATCLPPFDFIPWPVKLNERQEES